MNSLKRKVFRIAGWINSIGSTTTPELMVKVFYGYGHYKYAKKYADRRHEADGKTYYVLPYGTESLIVVNRLELQGMFRAKVDIAQKLKHAYYIARK